MTTFNPLHHPILFQQPKYLATSAWTEHLPFAMLLVDLLRPKLLVELGTHTGVSFFGFCQAVQDLGLITACYAVDHWHGDDHAGYYSQGVFRQVRDYQQQQYQSFSNLLKMNFDEAVDYFADGSIDLLHIDGLHTYEAVHHDFEIWLPKISPGGGILFHDIAVRRDGFGVWQLWEELRGRYPHFEMLHGHGLGVLAIGEQAREKLSPLLTLSEADQHALRQLLFGLGTRIRLFEGLYHQRLVKTEAGWDIDEEVAKIAMDTDMYFSLTPGDLIQYGNQKRKQGDVQSALFAYHEAIQRDGENSRVYYWRGLTYRRLDNHDAARRDFDTYLRLAGEDADPEKVTQIKKWLGEVS